MLRRERLGAPEDRDIALVLSDDRFGCRLTLGNSAPVDMDSSIPDNGCRLPCYITGPIFLLAATYVGLSTMSIVPIRPGIFLFSVLSIAMLACLAELPL